MSQVVLILTPYYDVIMGRDMRLSELPLVAVDEMAEDLAFRPVPSCCGASERTFISKQSDAKPHWPETELEVALRRLDELERRVLYLELRMATDMGPPTMPISPEELTKIVNTWLPVAAK